MATPLKELLRDLSLLHAPTGQERAVEEYMTKRLQKSGFKVEVDVLGNVIARKGKGKKVLVAAHMDEVSLSVLSITEKGFLKFVKVGGLYDGALAAQRVTVHAKKPTPGVIAMKAPHLMQEEELKQLQKHEDLFIDVGAKDKKDAESMGIRPGTNVTFDAPFVEMANDKVLGKAFDNRAGCAAMLKLAEEIGNPGCELVLVGTVREETGLWGAGTSVFGIQPDLAVALDVCLASGTPDVTEEKVPVVMGGGPSIGVLEAGGHGLIMNAKLVEWIEGVAKRNGIKYQIEVSEKGATDASRMQYCRSGFLTASIGIPSRYIHSPGETLQLKDLSETVRLMHALVSSFKNYK